MRQIAQLAYAKLNLALNVSGVKDGMHVLRSPSVRIDTADTVVVSEAAYSSVNYSVGGIGKGAVEKALDMLKAGGFGCFAVSVDKKIPIAGGTGGSSADAAALLNAAKIMYDIDPEVIANMAIGVGSDVPFMLSCAAGVISGVGDKVEFFDPVSMSFVLLRCGGAVTAAQCYRKFDELGCRGDVCDVDAFLRALRAKDFVQADTIADNALTEAACAVSSDILRSIEALKRIGKMAHMTGSGNTIFCFALDENDADRVCASIDPLFSPIVARTVSHPFKLI